MTQKINEQVSEAEAQLVSRANVISETFAAVGEHIGKSTNDAAKTIGVNTRELNAMLAARSAEITKILDETARPLVDRFTDSGGELQRSLEAATQQATERLRTENATLVNAMANRTAETLACAGGRSRDAFGQRQRPDRPAFRVELAAQRAHRSGQGEPARRRRAIVEHHRQVRHDHREGLADLRHVRAPHRRQHQPPHRAVAGGVARGRGDRQPLRRARQAACQCVEPDRRGAVELRAHAGAAVFAGRPRRRAGEQVRGARARHEIVREPGRFRTGEGRGTDAGIDRQDPQFDQRGGRSRRRGVSPKRPRTCAARPSRSAANWKRRAPN